MVGMKSVRVGDGDEPAHTENHLLKLGGQCLPLP